MHSGEKEIWFYLTVDIEDRCMQLCAYIEKGKKNKQNALNELFLCYRSYLSECLPIFNISTILVDQQDQV